jgi:hypothetical protein
VFNPYQNPSHYVINIGSNIPRSSLFRFENYWVDDVDFLKVVDLHWNNTAFYANAVRAGLKS